jgi:hypothetical protein
LFHMCNKHPSEWIRLLYNRWRGPLISPVVCRAPRALGHAARTTPNLEEVTGGASPKEGTNKELW